MWVATFIAGEPFVEMASTNGGDDWWEALFRLHNASLIARKNGEAPRIRDIIMGVYQ
jgi:hypothetical protein